MTVAADIPAWVALTTAALLLVGAGLTITGTLGLLRLDNFYKRVHAPTLGSTLGAGLVLIASMIWFTTLQTRLVIHEVLIAVFMTVTTPVTLMLLVRAAFSRDQKAKEAHDILDAQGKVQDAPENRHGRASEPS
ncbi:monovalent cation/H(+) antiporter subunit G [Pseudorhodoplanes sp.]|uniref:monovalent cation/H(+) antiporter subunit G n=1 Tax=Pseudorhodoplanes sp. TaxID=1934341 RepID=UPI002B7BBBAF|nr:monovalent cation/H(+) antiporter subunit G [Pseudorhodoplanes sp.]HWM83753.1 monovalent cation/H(+) antiporter subunit G [Pseudolabrys sp.]HWV55377.1 monovalent cation/H(+) antiporter subunit G [Pseudorhodoplanes sp.]